MGSQEESAAALPAGKVLASSPNPEVVKANGRHGGGSFVDGGGGAVGVNGSSLKADLTNGKIQEGVPAKRGGAGGNNSIKEDLKPVVICGPSGVGKGTLIARLMVEFPKQFGFSVSHTTRKPRNSEVDGVHYHFIERKEMEAQVRDGKFLEYADVHGNLYGTSIAAVEAVADTGKRCILDIDVQGAQQVKRSPLDALFIFIGPPSFEELEARLRGRGTETEEQVQKRLRNAKAEMERSSDATLFDHVLINDQLDDAHKKFKDLLGLDTT